MTSFYEELNKKKQIVDQSENVESRASIDKWIFRLFLVLLGVMPLIVLAHIEEVISPLVSNIDTISTGFKGELFTHYKALFVIGITVIATIMLLMKIFFMDGTIRKTWLNYVIGVLVAAIVISTIASPNISITLSGQYNRSDGAISWLCYVILLFIAMNIEYPKNFVRSIMYTMMPFIYINLIIITMNFYGKDLLQNYDWATSLVSLTLTEGNALSAGSQLVGTLNQWNFMSGMFAIMAVMYIAWAMTSKKWLEVIVGAVTAAVSVVIMLMAISTSGFVTIVAMLVFVLVAIFKVEKKAMAGAALGVLVVIVAPVFHILANENSRVWDESLGFFFDENPYVEEVVTSSIFSGNTAYASDAALELPTLPAAGYGAGSGRVYIWEKTFDLVKNRAILGYGVDSLMYNFPHLNIDARANLGDENIIVDKPHSMYMGSLYGFGIFGALAILLLAAVMLWNVVRSVQQKAWGVYIFAMAGLAYFVQALFNDSLPGTTSIAFVLVGICIANILPKKQDVDA